jgi:methionyl-tRNA formyltransferase
MRIVFAGTPEFAVPPLAALCASRHEVVGVLTQPDRPAGRGRKLATSAVKNFALQQGLPIAQPQTLRSTEGRESLVHWQPDVLVVVAYGLILPGEVLSMPRFGCLNIHASLLPRWRGAAPIQRAILAGDEYTGVTLMQMDAGLDTGPMMLQRRVAIGADVDSAALHATLAQVGAEALLETLEGLETGTLAAQPQPSSGVTYAAKIDKAEARIDWQHDAIDIARRVRAFRPWPIAETSQRGEQVRIHEAVVIGDAEAGRAAGTVPGTLLGLRADRLLVACGRDCLGIGVLQRAGRRSVTAREFANTAGALTESFQ